MKIAMCASEVVPFAKTGGLADVAGALPLALEAQGAEVIIIMPKYKNINDKSFKISRTKSGLPYSLIGKDIKVYFIENDLFFGRDFLYTDKNGDYTDNLDRFAFYCKQALELLKAVNFKADIIHIHDWQASLIAAYLKKIYKNDAFYKNMKTLLTIHNIGYQGLFAKEQFSKLGLGWDVFTVDGLEFYDKINILKGGMEFSDAINTVSPTYSKEILTKEFGFGLEGVLNNRRSVLSGILNGLDCDIWNPQTDKAIAKNFSVSNLDDKQLNKEDLQRACKLPVKRDVLLFGIVSRLAQQKGFDILSDAMPEVCDMGVQVAILGAGDAVYQNILEDLAKKFPKIVSLNLKFDDNLAHKIYAGSDVFLMPSRYEPCGLGQLISMRYGTIPLVFKTGGLADTVNNKNGFVFDKYSKEELVKTIKLAVKAFSDKKSWQRLTASAMKEDFSWKASAKKYALLYEKIAK